MKNTLKKEREREYQIEHCSVSLRRQCGSSQPIVQMRAEILIL